MLLASLHHCRLDLPAETGAAAIAVAADRDTDRPLRVGYLFGDFRNHPMPRFLPLLRGHDRTRISAFCYSDVRRPTPRRLGCERTPTAGGTSAA
jgi:predicted O-linked N-acetylglucosamine transferase (SPINDLY family)